MRHMAGQWLANGWPNVAPVTVDGWPGWPRPAISEKKRKDRQPVENTKPQVRSIFIFQHTSPAYEKSCGDGWPRPAWPAIWEAR